MYFVGLDIGSTDIKICLVDEALKLIDHRISPSGGHFRKNAEDSFQILLERNGLKKSDIAYLVSTGYGRKLYKGGDETISEITANARGAMAIMSNGSRPIKTIINIGGQDLKVIALNEDGLVKNFAMNDKCAAGTGRFLEAAARSLEVDLEDLETLHFEAGDAPLSINSTCTVFAESEIISLLAHGHGKGEIVAGIHFSIARRIARIVSRIKAEDMVFFDGGPAVNKGLRAALEDELMREIITPDIPQISTAYGAAIIARENYEYNDE